MNQLGPVVRLGSKLRIALARQRKEIGHAAMTDPTTLYHYTSDYH